MRIAQRTMYRSFITNMNKNLSDYMDSNIQSATQKRINKPSDVPWVWLACWPIVPP